MPRKVYVKPGPKSRQQKSKADSSKNVKSFLGDGSTTEESAAEGESFLSADLDGQTDYGLEFTTSRIESPRRARHSNLPRASHEHQQQNEPPTSFRRAESPRRTRQSNSLRHSSEQVQNEQPTSSTARKSATDKPSSSVKRRRKQRNPEQIDRRFWKEVRKLQLRTDNLIPKSSFARVIREVLIQESTSADRVTVTALIALQEAAEMYLTNLFQDAYCCTLHRGRVTLNVKDIELTRFLRGQSDPGNR